MPPVNSNGVSQWRTRPVFISSTFRDMQAERDYLRNFVFPRLVDEKLRGRRHHLEAIDLRQGVDSGKAENEEQRELLVLKVCLDEITRSRPFLIVLLGDRYGWIPPAERMAAAVREAGFETSVNGKSVTALEIEYGIFRKDPAQRRRCFFYIRNPLPYDRMRRETAEKYSDAHSVDAAVRAGHDRLEALKSQIKRDPELSKRVHSYDAEWDHDAERVTGLKKWGEAVFEHFWAELEEETRVWALAPAPSWEEEERAALAEFVEHRSRDFTGRKDTIEQLLKLAKSRAAEGPAWGACVTGPPGSGKSALFAGLVRKLEADSGVLLLANAAGATQRGSSVDAMLRRWIGELAAFLGGHDLLPPEARVEEVDVTFASLLGRASLRKRVVVLLDAINQFEPTARARYLTWRPQLWPPNARLVATMLPGPEAEALRQRAGVEEIDLPALTKTDARAIAVKIWERYHVPWSDAVWQALASNEPATAGTGTTGNPLWTTLACEELSLLDADDFDRAEREYADERDPQARLALLRRDRAAGMPRDVPGLYKSLLAHSEKVHGIIWARSFAVAIALSRHGWRESDLRAIIPRIAGLLFQEEATSEAPPLKLAELRRAFRAHLIRRGTEDHWDFHHDQMRLAVEQHANLDEEMQRRAHATISDFLEKLPAFDTIIRFERMRQLISERNTLRAARYYASLDATIPTPGNARVGSSWMLAEWIAAGETRLTAGAARGRNPQLRWIIEWLDAQELGREELHRLANNLQFGLFEKLVDEVVLGTRNALIRAVNRALKRLVDLDPGNGGWQRDLAASYNKLGDVTRALGDRSGALTAYRCSLEAVQRLADADPDNADWRRDLSLSFERLGDLEAEQGHPAEAEAWFVKSRDNWESLLQRDPTNTDWQRGVTVPGNRIGNLRLAEGDLDGAEHAYRTMARILRQLADAEPGNTGRQRDLSVTYDRIGDVLRDRGDFDDALGSYRQSLEVQEHLAANDPGNARLKSDLSVTHERIGDVHHAKGDHGEALCAYRQSLNIRQRLAEADPDNAGWERDLGISFCRMAEMAESNDTDDSRDWWRKAHALFAGMKGRGILQPMDEPYLRHLAAKLSGA